MLSEELDPIAFKGIPPGTRVKVFDHLVYKDDVSTPPSATFLPATVICHYGTPLEIYNKDFSVGPYPSLIDVVYDHRPDRLSKGHFTYAIEIFEDDWFDADFLKNYNKRFAKDRSHGKLIS